MHPADILAAVKKVKSSARLIAEQENCDPSFVVRVISGEKTSHPVAYAIAAKTGIPTEKMWPGRYLRPVDYRVLRKNNASGRLPRVASY